MVQNVDITNILNNDKIYTYSWTWAQGDNNTAWVHETTIGDIKTLVSSCDSDKKASKAIVHNFLLTVADIIQINGEWGIVSISADCVYMREIRKIETYNGNGNSEYMVIQ